MMWGFQAAGAAPIVKNKIVKKPETIATAIRIEILRLGIKQLPLRLLQRD